MSENKRRYLAPKARRGDGHGYVDMPAMGMHEEPECLTEAEWHAHVAGRAETTAEQQQRFEEAKLEQARRLLSFEERLVEVTREARSAKRRIDVGSEVRFLRLMQQQGKKVRHLEQRLVLIERKVYREDEAA
jgi:transcription elongation GreA/GreB family factor